MNFNIVELINETWKKKNNINHYRTRCRLAIVAHATYKTVTDTDVNFSELDDTR